MKKIVINGRFLTRRVTGVERYAREICAELDRMAKPGRILMAVPPETEDLPDYRDIKIVRVGRLHNRMWEHLDFPAFVRQMRAVSLNLCNTAPLADPGIVCIHDVKIKARPGDFSRKFLLWYSLLFKNETRRALKIITVSEFSKSEIEKYYGVEPERIAVIPDAWQHYERVGYDEETLPRYGLEKGEYYFSMCSFEPNKNLRWIAEAARRNPDRIFAVAGGINKDVFADGIGFECPENMKLLGYAGDEEGKTLMRDCRAFLFPSFYEGFGIPPVEALCAGCRSLAVSDTAVMHEMFGDAVNYIDPEAYDADLGGLKKITDADAAAVLSKYSWKKSARLLAEVLRTV